MNHTLPLARAALTCVLITLGASPALADTPAEREVEAALVRADHEAVRLLRILDETRRARNLAQIACVDQQLSQINGFIRLLELRRDRLQAAIDRGDASEVARERQIVRRMYAQLAVIARAGLACVYPPAGEADTTIVDVVIEPAPRHRDLSPHEPVRD